MKPRIKLKFKAPMVDDVINQIENATNNPQQAEAEQIANKVQSILDNTRKPVPFWKECTSALEAQLPQIDNFWTKQKSDSWFDVSTTVATDQSKISFQSALIDPLRNKNSADIKIVTNDQDRAKYKTMRFRLFPTQAQKELLKLINDQYRWYYNFTVETFNRFERDNPYGMRQAMQNYVLPDLDETVDQAIENSKSYYIPRFWDKVHTRVIRGAIHSFTANVKSAISNFRNGHSHGFQMHLKSQKREKSRGYVVTFEDQNYPAELNKIKGRFGYRTGSGRRVSVSPQEVRKEIGTHACSFMYEACTDRYFLLYPVSVDYYPSDDHRKKDQAHVGENQAHVARPTETIAVDPGVRKFLTGYSSSGSTLLVGDGANHRLMRYLRRIDKVMDVLARQRLWRRVKDLVADLHWKTVKHLTDNYQLVIVGDIHTQSILSSKRLNRMTKRVLCQYSFHQFKDRLSWKLSLCGGEMVLVNEAYTSKTCSKCGNIKHNLSGSETYQCVKCGLRVDRDLNGAKCIMLAALTLAND